MPATIAVLDGVVRIGLSDAAELDRLCASRRTSRKLSVRDVGVGARAGQRGATTVASTSALAHRAGIAVFATGGLGGVHRGAADTFDVSADLGVLASTPVLVVCAGVKSILDVPATLEYLETLSVPVLGYRTDVVPRLLPGRLRVAGALAGRHPGRRPPRSCCARRALCHRPGRGRARQPAAGRPAARSGRCTTATLAGGLALLAGGGRSPARTSPRGCSSTSTTHTARREPAGERRAGAGQRRRWPARLRGPRRRRRRRLAGDRARRGTVRRRRRARRGGHWPAPAGPIVPGRTTRAGRETGWRRSRAAPAGTPPAWLARHDVDVSLIARVGDDEAGRTASVELTAAGIDCRFAVDPGAADLLRRGAGRARRRPHDAGRPRRERRVLPWTTSRCRRSPAAAHLHLSGYVLLDDGSRPAGLAAFASARAAGWTTSVDPQSATLLAAAGADRFLRWGPASTCCCPTTPNSPRSAAAVAVRTSRAVVVTHGRHGASWLTRSERIDVPAPAPHLTDRPGGPDPAPPTVDSTGAGDAFNAGLLAEWVRGAEPRDALFAGVAAGTAAASRVGARPDQASGTAPR